MIRFQTAALAALMLMAATPAGAQTDIAAQFARFCLADGSSSSATIAMARKEGFVAPPAMAVDAFGSGLRSTAPKLDVASQRLLWTVYEDGLSLLMVGELQKGWLDSAPDLAGHLCAMVAMPSQDLRQEAEKLAGVPAQTKDKDSAVYMYSKQNGRVRDIGDMSLREAERELRSGRAHVLVAGAMDEGAMLLVMDVKP